MESPCDYVEHLIFWARPSGPSRTQRLSGKARRSTGILPPIRSRRPPPIALQPRALSRRLREFLKSLQPCPRFRSPYLLLGRKWFTEQSAGIAHPAVPAVCNTVL